MMGTKERQFAPLLHDERYPSAVVLPIIPAAPEEGEAYEVFM